jgi:hypothetical protein
MSSELRDRINEDAEMAREAIRRVIEIHGLGSYNEEVKSFRLLSCDKFTP